MTLSNNKKGFIALTATLMLTAVLTMFLISTGTSSFFARFDVLGSEFKRISLGLSESCINAALLKIAKDYNYIPDVGGDVVTIGPDTCIIKSVTYSAEDPVTHKKTATIETNAKHPEQNGSWSTNRIEISVANPAIPSINPPFNPSPISINSWEEVAP